MVDFEKEDVLIIQAIQSDGEGRGWKGYNVCQHRNLTNLKSGTAKNSSMISISPRNSYIKVMMIKNETIPQNQY